MATAPDQVQHSVWHAADGLSERVKRLRDQYFAFETRAFRNEVLPFTTGTPWDTVYACASWTNVPEVAPFVRAFEDSLAAAAHPVSLPDGFWNEALPVRVSMFFAEVIARHLPVDILEGELIVGGQFNVAMSLCLNKREAKRRARTTDAFVSGVTEASNLGIGNCGAVPGHLIPDYAKVLRVGFRGIAEEIESALGECDKSDQRATLQSFLIAVKAVKTFTARYADEAERLAAVADPQRAVELKEIARICRKVPWNPPNSFYEALQALWFTHMLVMVSESYPGPGVSFGRFDQYLYPFLEGDIGSGRLTRGQARELLQCFWVKPNYAYDYQGRLGRNQGINSSFGQLVTLGGCGPDGQDASNDLTYLCLEVIEDMNLLEPKPNVRLHKRTPDRLLNRICDMIAEAQGAPFLINFDENAMKGLDRQGVPRQDLWDYACVGCLENTRQGDDRSGTVDVNFNLAKPVELVLFQGRDLETGKQVGPKTASPLHMKTWVEFEAAFRRQLSHCLQQLLMLNDQADSLRAQLQPTPYLSAIVGGCIENAKDVTSGGARHNLITVEGIALATAADSLSAVKHLVFDTGRVAMSDLLNAVQCNFEGHEFLRQTLINKAPKYGNDDPDADRMAHDITQWWAEEASGHETPQTGKRYRAGYLSWNYGIAYAPVTSATPDGRKRGTFLANGVAAAQGRDRHGPTAAARSVGHLGLDVVPNGDSHTITLSPSIVRNQEARAKIAGFLRGYLSDGGTALQINVIDADTLRRAQEHPDEFRNLLVRVTGYNAYFVNLGREIQNEIIARTAHGQ